MPRPLHALHAGSPPNALPPFIIDLVPWLSPAPLSKAVSILLVASCHPTAWETCLPYPSHTGC
jgi:hypothetical protein